MANIAPNNWQTFFDLYASKYDEEIFTKGTVAEIDFLIDELKPATGATFLDIGCGTGRHAIELARRGFTVTGIDQSANMLAVARQRANEAQLQVTLLQADARAKNLDLSGPFDFIISLCEGAMCLLREDESPFRADMAILANVSKLLNPNGRFLTTVLNAFRITRSLPNDNNTFDTFTSVGTTTQTLDGPNGPVEIVCRERYYTPAEFTRMANRLDLRVQQFWSGTAGNWKREPVALDDIEFMAIIQKKLPQG